MLKDLPAAMRPREKLLALGPAALADAELLALLLRTGLKGLGVLQMAEKMLQDLGGVSGLLQAAPQRLKTIKGLGPAKRAELLAVTELARRGLQAQLRESPVFTSPQMVKDYLQMQIDSLKQINAGATADTPFIQTIFDPMSQAKNLVGKENLLVHMRQQTKQHDGGDEPEREPFHRGGRHRSPAAPREQHGADGEPEHGESDGEGQHRKRSLCPRGADFATIRER